MAEISQKLLSFQIDTDTNSSIHTFSDAGDSTETESLVDRSVRVSTLHYASLYLYISISLRFYVSTPLCLYASLFLCLYIFTLLCLYTSIPLCLYISIPLCLYISIPLCLYISIPLCLYISISLYLYISVPLPPHTVFHLCLTSHVFASPTMCLPHQPCVFLTSHVFSSPTSVSCRCPASLQTIQKSRDALHRPPL